MKSRYLPLAILAVCFLFINQACDSSSKETSKPAPTPEDPARHAAKLEDDFQGESSDITSEMRSDARRAAVEFVTTRLPKWKIKGIASESYQANVFWLDVDIEKDGRSVVISLAARKFFPESGEPYWKATLLQRTLEARLHDAHDAALLKELNDAKNELDDLKNPPVDEGDRPDPY